MADRTVELRGQDGDHLSIEVGMRAHPGATDFDDGNWLSTRVTLRAGGFAAEVAATLRAEELRAFRDALRALDETLRGSATFATMEGWFELGLEVDRRGRVTASGFLIDDHTSGNRLRFTLRFDQTELKRMIRELDAVLSVFPVVGE